MKIKSHITKHNLVGLQYLPNVMKYLSTLVVPVALAACGVEPTPNNSSAAVSSSSVATTVSSSSKSSSSAAPVVTIPAGSAYVYAVNAGGAATTVGGVKYEADQFSTGGTAGSTTDPIGGTNDDVLYQSERWGKYKYEVPVTNSTYSVMLRFSEMYQTSAGQRYFSASVEGQPVFTDMDLFAEYGQDYAYDVVINNVMVADEKLTIDISASLDNGTIAAFAIFSNAGGKFVKPTTPPITGKNHKYFVGNITTGGQVRSDFKNYWNQITPENEGKWGSVEKNRDQYNWGGVDRAYNYAQQNNILFKQHTFVWGAQSPGWLNNLGGNDAKAEIEEWIHDFCAKYPNTPIIDVVNEATPGHQPARYAENAYGSNWITEVFKVARRECPNSILVLNDYNVLSWNTDQFINMARNAAASGYVDAIGFQAHGLESFSVSQLKDAMNKIENALHLPFYVTEYDVAKTNDQEQLNIFRDQFTMFYNDPRVKGITIWGYVVGQTWVTGSGLIQSNGNFRPAMTWLMDYIKANPKN